MELRSILVVDDDAALRTRLAASLEERGYAAREAGDFASAEAMLADWEPGFAILDLRLSREKTGIDVLRAIRERGYRTKAVMLTGFGSIPAAVEAGRLGIIEFLAKPVGIDQLLSVLEGESARSFDSDRFQSLRESEWEHLQRALYLTNGNISRASGLLKIPRRSLQRKLQRGK